MVDIREKSLRQTLISLNQRQHLVVLLGLQAFGLHRSYFLGLCLLRKTLPTGVATGAAYSTVLALGYLFHLHVGARGSLQSRIVDRHWSGRVSRARSSRIVRRTTAHASGRILR